MQKNIDLFFILFHFYFLSACGLYPTFKKVHAKNRYLFLFNIEFLLIKGSISKVGRMQKKKDVAPPSGSGMRPPSAVTHNFLEMQSLI